MPEAIRNTVDRLDKPSAYYLGKVCVETLTRLGDLLIINGVAEQEAQVWSRSR
jgi:hypothetical protein